MRRMSFWSSIATFFQVPRPFVVVLSSGGWFLLPHVADFVDSRYRCVSWTTFGGCLLPGCGRWLFCGTGSRPFFSPPPSRLVGPRCVVMSVGSRRGRGPQDWQHTAEGWCSKGPGALGLESCFTLSAGCALLQPRRRSPRPLLGPRILALLQVTKLIFTLKPLPLPFLDDWINI